MKPLVVFVDDSSEEIRLFEEVLGSHYNLVLGQSADEALGKLATASPGLILLDVYIPEEGKDREVPGELAEVKLELPPDQGDLRQAYNNLIFAQQRFAALQEARAHGLLGGLKLARTFAEKFPSVPLIGYSRKSSPLECLIYLATIPTAVDFVQKPNDPQGWQETCELTKLQSARLRMRFDTYLGVRRLSFEHRRAAADCLLREIELLSR